MISITDFLLFTGETDINKVKYAAIFKSVISTVENIYKIILSERTEDITLYPDTTTTVVLEHSPISSINSITQNGESLAFTYQDNTITLPVAITDTVTPLVINITYGYTAVPEELKYALYNHMQSVYYASTNHTANVSKVINSTGNTVFFREGSIPIESRTLYDYYSKRQIII